MLKYSKFVRGKMQSRFINLLPALAILPILSQSRLFSMLTLPTTTLFGIEWELGTGRSLLLVLITLIWLWVRNRMKILGTFRAMGISGPAPHFVYGNMHHTWLKKTPWLMIEEWRKQYGNVFGCFPLGIRPTLVIADREMIQEILIGNFSNFRNRPALGPPRTEPGASALTSIRGEKWKRVRSVISPTFHPKKILQMMGGMTKAADTLVGVLDDHQIQEKPFDVYGMFQALTLDVIAQSAFALKVDSQTNPDDQLLKVCRALFKSFFSPVLKALLLFPEIGNAATFIRSHSKAANKEFYVITHMRDVVNRRREEPNLKGNDMIQLMMDATDQITPSEAPVKCPTSSAANSKPCEQERSTSLKPPASSRYLTENELVANCFVFLLAGYETTANALAFTTYLLSKHQEVQQRLYQEIIDVVGAKLEPDFGDKNTKMPYLEAVINESLRMYPPITGFITRECQETCVIKGLTIPAGMSIHIPVWSLHHDPELWTNPDAFMPERFLDNNASTIPPMAYMPFGEGPRNCIGMTFALMEIKVTLVRILQRFRIVEAEQPNGEMELECPFVTMNPKNGVFIRLEKR